MHTETHIPANPLNHLESISLPLQRMLHALSEKRFFKLIGGGSLTEADRLEPVAKAYAMAGADCIDVAPDMQVVSTLDRMLSEFSEQAPVLMVSLPLDPDPHFRKIELDEPNCIQCGACLPVCPTEAITLPNLLEISQSLCYGCGRCVPICPTEALKLLPFQLEDQLETVLSHPRVEAVEIHSHYVDPYMLKTLFECWGSLLTNKLISLCFRPGNLPAEQIISFYQTATKHCSLSVMLQIDGSPMSGNDDPGASRPALEAAVMVAEIFQHNHLALPPITISGGINQHTAVLLQEPQYQFIAGVGMGTVARKAIWHLNEQEAESTARHLLNRFKN